MSWSHNCERDHFDDILPNCRRCHTIMSPEDVAAGKKSHWPELEITGPIRNLSPALWKMSHLTSLYLNDNHLSHIPPEIANLTCLIHLDLSSNQLQSLPPELGDIISLRELLLNHNYLRELPNELGKLFRIYNLDLRGNPLSPEIISIYNKPNGTQNLLSHLLNNLTVSNIHPPRRPWRALTDPDRSRPTCVFTVMCYNILCDKLATRQLYGYCPDWALDWKYRRKGIMDEIRHYGADIIALQEVETGQFFNFFLPTLRRDGYDGIFAPKSRAKTMSENERQHVDGCAIFYRVNKFSLLKHHLVEFNQLAMANAEGSDNMLNRVMTKDNIGLTALLQTKEMAFDNGLLPEPSQVHQPLLVCTAHIHWDPEFCDVKLIQTMMLMQELRSIVDDAIMIFQPRCPKPEANDIPLVLCGDFNSLPESGVIEFLTTGHISANHSDFKQLAYKDCLQRLGYPTNKNSYSHPFKVSHAYSDSNMPYTNFTCDFRGIIDYVFFSTNHMSLLGLLGPIDPEWMKQNKVHGCPHPHVPSDHFPLLVELEFVPVLLPPTPLPNGFMVRR